MTPRKLATTIFIVFLTTLLIGCEKEETQPDKKTHLLPTAAVTVAKVTKRIAANQVEVVGTVQAVEQAEISSKITGNIITLQVDLGSRIKQGELLVELSAGEISAQLQQAKAQLEQTKRNLAREEKLLKKNAATPESVKSLRDSFRIAEAAHREALTMLDYTRITAPFSGMVTRKLANVGDLATPGKPLLRIEEENKLQVLTDIPEAMILKIKKDDRLPVFLPSVGITIEGIVAEVSPTVDPSSRSAPIKLRIESDPRLRSGQFARVTLTMEQAETLIVPTGAVVPFGQMERVFVEIDGKARLRLVRTGDHKEDHIEVLSGLLENETVISSGNANLLDGQPVAVQ
jgi:RND family efflux transporter MFP subunit